MSEVPAPPVSGGPPSVLPPNPAANSSGRSSAAFGGIVLVLVLVLGGVWFLRHRQLAPAAGSMGGKAGGYGAGPATVTTIKAVTGDIGVYVNALGSVTPINQVSINSRVPGQIVKINYQEGQLVQVGDPLIEIDPGPNQAALTQAEGQLERDMALLANARLDLQRYQAAFASNAIPEQQMDTQLATVQQYEGTVKLDQGQLDNARVQLAYCYLTAPISGRVGLRLVDQGNMVQANSTNLLTITQLQPISVIFDVAEDYLPQIQKQLRQGDQLAVDVFDRDLRQKLASGTLETLDNQINPTTGTVQLRAIFTNEDESLFPNQFVNARLLVNTLHHVTLLPNTVIQRNADSAFVYALPPAPAGEPAAGRADTNQPPATETVSQQTITVGTTDGNVSQVQGIEPGTVVVADNFNKLADGVKVIVRSAGAKESGGSGTRQHHASADP
jgi:multidrug efflux system membrane fusion protein